MDTIDLLRARQSGPWSRVKLLDDGKMSYSMEGPPSLDIGRMTLEYCLTSPVIDREGDLILPDAPDWTDHERNPLTLFNHKLDQPFGKSQDTAGRYTVERRGDRWYGKSYLFQNDPFAEEVYRLAEKGALNGASIGFLPAKPPFGQSSVKKMSGYDYTVIERCKVFEWSAVYIPMNQDALLVAAEVVRKGLGNKPLSDRALAMFSPYVGDAPVWSNGWNAKGTGWNESDHPRADDGKFGSGGGSGKDDKKQPQGKPDSVPKPGDKRFEMVEKLARTQAIEANYMREKQGLKPLNFSDYDLKWLPLDEVKPSQSGEDYKNASSEELAKKIGEFLGSGRKQDYAPIVVDENMTIIDGNHRHAARVMAGIKEIPVLVPKVKSDKKQSSILADEKKMSSLSGAPEGASVEVSPDEDGKGSMIYFSDSDKKQRLYSGAIYVRDDGDGLKMKIESLEIRPDAQGQGIGKKIVEDIIANAKANSIEEISVGARRTDGMNGYYSWARYGFDCPIPFDKVLPLPKSLDSSKTVQDLMKTKEGRDWWKENGTSVRMYLNPQKGEKSLAPIAHSNKPAHRLNGKFKMYDDNTDQTQPPVDPIEAKTEDAAPATPLGAQLIAGAHEIAMGLAKFYTDNVAQLEPELVQEFSKLEKTIMSSIAAMAQMFNGRYADLPPLDGADWVDPDMDGDIDTTDDPVLNPDAEDDLDMEEAKSISEENANGDDATAEDADATDDGDDATPDEDKSDKADQQRQRLADEDAHDDEEADTKPRFKKSFEEAAKRSLKSLLEGWQAKQKALKDAAKKIEHPDAVVAVKAVAQFLRTMAGDPREDKALRGRAKKLRSDLLNALPKVKAKAVVEIAPQVMDIDLDRIADHFNSARKAMEVDAQAIQEKINKLFQLTGR